MPADLLAARLRAAEQSLPPLLEGIDLGRLVAVLHRAAENAPLVGRPLFAGLRAQAWSATPTGQLWQLCHQLREHRGDSHIAACVAAGLHPIEMNLLTELWLGMPAGPYTATRGWSDAQIAAALADLAGRGLVGANRLTPAGQALRDEIELRTDRGEEPLVEAMAGDFDWAVGELRRCAERCIEAGKFTADPYKRAAG